MRALIGSARFRRLWAAYAVSGIGDAMTATTMILWAYRVGGQRAALVGGVVLAAFLPPVAVGFLLGGLADRYDRRTVMVVADLARTVLAVALAVATRFGHPVPALCCLALMAAARALFDPARKAAIPHVVDTPQLPRANAVMATTAQVSFVLGPPIAAVVFGRLGPTPAILFDGTTFIVSAVLLLPLRLTAPVPDAPTAPPDAVPGRAAVRALLASQAALLGTLAAAFLAASAGVNNTVMVMFLDHDLHGRAADVAWLSAANGVAQIVAGGAVVAVASRLPLRRGLAGAGAVMAVFSAVLAAAPGVPIAIAAVVAVALANAPFTISYTTICQLEVPDAVVGRAFALSAGLRSGTFLIGSLGGAWLADAATARTSIAASAGCMAGAALLTLPLWRGANRPVPAAVAIEAG